MKKNKMSSDTKDTIIGFITIGVIVALGFIFVPKMISSFNNHQTSSPSSTKKESSSTSSNIKDEKSSSSSSSNKKQETSSSSSQNKESAKKTNDTKTYNDTEALSNAQNFNPDDYENDANIGKSVHLTNAKIARIDKADGGLWIETINDDNNPKTTHVQAVNLSSYKLSVGDVVDIKATLQGKQKSMVTFSGDTDKYPTIWISSIDKIK
ncbi:hypothetical protein [Fructobacillus cardui]|uniref:hypothetical protein n=1 Tax=Fructobacillus cardui TaxID=2893170 RepID=UPI002D9F3746|nr:unnamed protein product [Fructobacillus cardui]